MSRNRWKHELVAASLLPLVVRGHMELSKPPAVYSKNDPQTAEANKDYSMTSPLAADGSDYPAKKRCTSEILSALKPVATLVSGQEFEWTLAGTAVHNGGSCQVAISYDNCETMAVMASWIGGCPLSLPYKFKVPELPGADKAFFVWEWSNKSGNRELYQNVAVVSVQGTAKDYVGPANFRANTFASGTCINPETVDVVYPNPGDQVFYGGSYSDSSPPAAADFSCPDYDNTATVTVKNSGGGSGPTGAPEGESTPSPSGDATDSDQGGGNTPATPAPAPGETGGGTAAGGETGSGNTAGEGTGNGKPTGAPGGQGEEDAGTSGNTAAAPKTTGGGATSSSPTTSSPSSSTSSSTNENFIKFAMVVLVVLALATVAVCLLKRRHTTYSKAQDDDSTDSADSGSSSSDSEDSHRERKHGGSRRHGRSKSHRHRGHGYRD